MTWLLLGLLIFVATHSLRLVAPGWREAAIARLGAGAWRGLYSLLSLAGFVLIVVGYAAARQEPVLLYLPPTWASHLAATLTLPAFVLAAASLVPGTWIRARLGHPLLAGTKLWALAHLFANGMLADVLLFGSFLLWSVVAFAVCRRRDRQAGTRRVAMGWSRDLLAVLAGGALWALFAFWLHARWFGVAPFG